MADYGSFTTAGKSYPLTAARTNPLLQDADPTLFYALDFFAWLLGQYAGARWAAEAQADAAGTFTSPYPIVAYKVPYDPEPYLTEQQIVFPLLAVYRRATKFGQASKTWRNDACNFGVAWVLPPLTGAQLEQLGPMRDAVKDILDHGGEQGWDPAYAPPGQATGYRTVWKLANIESFVMDSAEWGDYPGTGNLVFPAIRCECTIKERVAPSVFQVFAGADITETLVASDGTSPPVTVTAVSTQGPPAPTSVLPATGSVAGGTTITISGSLFGVGAIGGVQGVTIGGRPCTSVTWVNATTVTCKTPAQGNPGAMDVVVTNLDGQRGTLAGGFTYTTP